MTRRISAAIVACIVTLSIGARAHSDVTVWFELVSGDAGVATVGQGPGQVLQLKAPDSPVPFEFTARMRANITGLDLYSANTTLSADYPVAVTSATLIPPEFGGVQPINDQGTYGPGDIATNFGGATFFMDGYFGDNVDLGTITFTVDPAQGPFDAGTIYARVGLGLWAESDASGTNVRFGTGAFADSTIFGAGNAPVIQFVPEPMTALLFGFSSVMLIRRKRMA